MFTINYTILHNICLSFILSGASVQVCVCAYESVKFQMRQYISIVIKCRRMIQTNKQMRIYRVRSVNDRQDGRRKKKKKNRTKYGTERSDAMKSRWIAFGVCNLRNLFDLVVSHSNRQTIFFSAAVIYYCCYWFSVCVSLDFCSHFVSLNSSRSRFIFSHANAM